MKLSISNIGWDEKNDEIIFKMMRGTGFSGLEIAPTRIFPVNPYDRLKEAREWSRTLKNQFGLHVSSMQSIWFGRKENIFSSIDERNTLANYTKRAIDFAVVVNCKNLVFGCPRNRNVNVGCNSDSAIDFFKLLADYAYEHGTVIGMEANPIIYNTNYITDTRSALRLIEEVDSNGFKLNLDLGTMIQNEESVDELKGYVSRINHVHISEPGLKPIQVRQLHKELKEILLSEGYQGFISIEMGKVDNIGILEEKMAYIRRVFE